MCMYVYFKALKTASVLYKRDIDPEVQLYGGSSLMLFCALSRSSSRIHFILDSVLKDRLDFMRL